MIRVVIAPVKPDPFLLHSFQNTTEDQNHWRIHVYLWLKTSFVHDHGNVCYVFDMKATNQVHSRLYKSLLGPPLYKAPPSAPTYEIYYAAASFDHA